MVEVHFNGETFQLNRIIAKVKSKNKKSIVVFIGGIHGNEPTGVVALQKVFSELKTTSPEWLGDVYALIGNMSALSLEKRYIDRDLNRAWTPNEVLNIKEKKLEKTIAETEEQYALYDIIWPLLEEGVPIYLIDLHTTSSSSVPFITINDILANRDFSKKFPSPIVLGIEEYIAGPLLSYMNNHEAISLAFEGGQHQDIAALENHISFIYTALVHTGSLAMKDVAQFDFHEQRLAIRSKSAPGFYEIRHKKAITFSDKFKMNDGFVNFDKISKGQLLATDKNGEIKAKETGRIFMPLYQSQGTDGFFIVRSIPKFALTFSRLLRKMKVDSLLTVLPGVQRDELENNTILVNNRIALFMVRDLFHLLGYRRKKTIDNTQYFSRREVD